MTSYFRRAELMGLSQLRSKQDLVPSSSRTLKHRETHTSRKGTAHPGITGTSARGPTCGRRVTNSDAAGETAGRYATGSASLFTAQPRARRRGCREQAPARGGQHRPSPSEPDGLSLCPIPPAPRGQLLVMRVPGKQMGSRAA